MHWLTASRRPCFADSVALYILYLNTRCSAFLLPAAQLVMRQQMLLQQQLLMAQQQAAVLQAQQVMSKATKAQTGVSAARSPVRFATCFVFHSCCAIAIAVLL
jgi:hypothetical protein